MRLSNLAELRVSTRAAAERVVLSVLFCILGWVDLAFAIPSPELVVGSLSSLSQLLTIGSAMLGGTASLIAGRSLLKRGRPDQGSRLGWKIACGLLVLCLGMAALASYQLIEYRAERTARLEATLLRPARQSGSPVLDPDVKELTFGQQQKHPLGISTAESQTLLNEVVQGRRPDLMFLDVRETAESEMGLLPGSTAVRFPDFSSSAIDTAGKQVILYCHNGNRSHETCEMLKAQGVDCRFIIGGLEKWVVEQRLLTNLSVRTLDSLRAVPPYRNQRTLLDTPDVHRLIKNEGATFVDVRYAKEFAGGHLPGAINLAIRRTPTQELGKRLAELPKMPVILPCYDRRGCFFAEVLGLELSRAGHDVRGRYTAPWDYFVAGGRPPHVEQWVAESQLGWWARAVRALSTGLAKFSEAWGLTAGIALLALASRLLVLPFSWKSERDQLVARQLTDQVETLKARLEGDPTRLARAMRTLYRRHGLTPLRNLVALAFLPALALSIAAVQQVAVAQKPNLWWLANLAERDPLGVLPLFMAALLGVYVHIAITSNRKHRLLLWGIAFPMMVAGGALLGAAANIYIVFSAALLLVQRVVLGGGVSAVFAALRRLSIRCRRRLAPVGVVQLSDQDGLAHCGNKAHRLAQLLAHQFPVPDGVVLTARFLARFSVGSESSRRRQLDWIWRRLGSGHLAVRSSAAAEDGVAHSFAGVFETLLDVHREGLAAAIAQVDGSFTAARVDSYGIETHGRNILVQQMIAADYAGVLFTRDPAAAGCTIVEMVQGTGAKLVSGLVAAEAYRFGRHSGRLVGSLGPPIDLAPLLELARRAEQLFSRPQDIEWAYRQGRFFILQSRDITAPIARAGSKALVQQEWARVVERAATGSPDEIMFIQNEMSEVLPKPTLLSLSLMEELWASGGSVDLACRSLGLTYKVEEDSPSYLVSIFGRLYIDRRQEQMRAPELDGRAVRRYRKNKHHIEIEREFREKFLPTFLDEVVILEAVEFDRLSTTALFDMMRRIHENFVTNTHVQVTVINIAAKFYLDEARKVLNERGLDVLSCLSVAPETVVERLIADAARTEGPARRDLLLAGFGHRAVLDYELQTPRYSESPAALNGLMGLVQARAGKSTNAARHAKDAEDTNADMALECARRLQNLKEDAKHHSLRELAVLRQVILALDRRLGFDGLIFHLTLAEVSSLRDRPATELRGIAERRAEERRHFDEVAPLPVALSIVDLEASSLGATHETTNVADLVRGQRVSGTRIVEARACVVERDVAERGAPIVGFEDGDVIVSPMIHPAWLPYVLRAGGLVSEIGGWLSHMAIIAREHDLPMIVNARGLGTIEPGCIIRLHPDGAIETIGDGLRREQLAEAAE